MSLSQHLRLKQVRLGLERIVPDVRRRTLGPVLAPAPAGMPPWVRGTVGMALDYAIRFELKRLCPWATEGGPWAAELALRSRRAGSAPELVGHWPVDARAFLREYVRLGAMPDAVRDQLFRHTLRLARLEAIYRAPLAIPDLDEPCDREVDELSRLFALVPFAQLTDHTTVILNPSFAWLTEAIDGADADLVTGTRLVDFTTEATVSKDKLLQVLGYFLLARAARDDGAPLPHLDSVEVYLARRAEFVTYDAVEITALPAFAEVESWFLKEVVKADAPRNVERRARWLATQRRGPKRAPGLANVPPRGTRLRKKP